MKRFLSLFAILALVVSMFAGVGFATLAQNQAYDLEVDNSTVVHEDETAITVTVNPTTSIASESAADLNTYSVSVYNSGGVAVAGVSEMEIAAGSSSAVFAGTEIATLGVGTYTIKLSATPGAQTLSESGTTQTIDLDGSGGAGTANVEVVTFEVTKNDQDLVDDELANLVDFTLAKSDSNAGTAASASLGNGVTAQVTTSSNANIASDGTVTFTAAPVTGDVLFTLSKGSATATKTVSVTVPKKDDDLNVVLDIDKVSYNANNTVATIPGKIINNDSKALAKVDGRIMVYPFGESLDTSSGSSNNVEYSIEFTGGEFNLKVYPSVLGIGKFNVAGFIGTYNGETYTLTDASYNEVGVFTVQYDMELAEPEELSFDYPTSGQVVLKGIFPNEDAKSLITPANALKNTELVLAYYDTVTKKMALVQGTSDGDIIARSSFANTKGFGFLFDGLAFTKKGNIGLFIQTAGAVDSKDVDNYLLVMSGKVNVGTFETAVTKEVPKNIGSQKLIFELGLPTTYLKTDGKTLKDNYRVQYTIEDSKEVAHTDHDDLTLVGSAFDKIGQVKELTIFVDGDTNHPVKAPFELGDYTVKLELQKNVTPSPAPSATWVTQLTSTTEFEVGKADNYNLLAFDTETEHRVGDFTFIFNASTGADQPIHVVKKDGSDAEYLEMIVKGCGVDKTFRSEKYDANYNDTNNTEEAFTVKTSETGTLEVTINVYEGAHATDVTPDYTFTRNITITGWNVEITPSKVTVGSEEDIIFTIVDEEGNPINNAFIRVIGTNTILVDGRSTNINGGVYTYSEDKQNVLEAVGHVALEFVYEKADTTEDPVVTNSTAIEVVGENVFSVTSSADTLLNGIGQTFTVEVLNDEGDIVYPTFERVNVKDDKETASEFITVGDRKDIDGDGVKESVEITVVPNADQQEMIIRATMDSGKKMGEARIAVVKPEVVMTGAKTFTDNFNTSLEFQVIDPRDNSVMEDLDLDLVVDGTYVTSSTFGHVDSKSLTNDNDVWSGTYRSIGADFTQAAKDEKDINVNLVMTGDKINNTAVEVTVLPIPVAKAILTATPDNVIIGSATNVTLTYTDADGNPLAEREITLGDDTVGETNEQGQVIYSSSATSSLSMTFKAETDDPATTNAKVTTLKVTSKADVVAPTVEVTSINHEKGSALLTIKDNVRLYVTYVNDKKVDMYFPREITTHVVEGLKPGVNKVEFLSADINNNYTEQTLEITIDKPVVKSVEFTLNEEIEGLGTPVKVNGKSMVPVRLVQKLGVTFNWDAANKTVTYTYGEYTIVLTIDSKTAVVNGENVELEVAPYLNEKGSSMVPVRMVGSYLGFDVKYTSDDAPIIVSTK